MSPVARKPGPFRILMCTTSTIVHPGQSTYAKEFCKRGCEVLHVNFHNIPKDREAHIRDVAKYRENMNDYPTFTLVPCEMKEFAAPRKRFYHRFQPPARLTDEAEEAIAKFQPDVIYAYDLWAVGMAYHIRIAPRLLYFSDPDFQVRWYHSKYAIQEDWRNILRLPVWLMRCYRYMQYYRLVCTGERSVFVLAKHAINVLAKIGIQARYLPYTWPVAERKLDCNAVVKADKPTFMFYGGLGALGSRSALHLLLEKIYPLLVKLWGAGGFRVYICGKLQLPDWAAKLVEGKAEIEYLGFVDDLSLVMEQCHAAIFPVDVPVGNRIRVLSAMNAGILIIAHAMMGRLNASLVDGETCYLAETPEEFVQKMKCAVEHPEEAPRLRMNARKEYDENYSPAGGGGAMYRRLLEAAGWNPNGTPP